MKQPQNKINTIHYSSVSAIEKSWQQQYQKICAFPFFRFNGTIVLGELLRRESVTSYTLNSLLSMIKSLVMELNIDSKINNNLK
jgi:hypothetical protein